ncbi:MAG: nucleotidyltransferase family protein [Oleiphilaceae bacterium]|nr:nucleotidyltransferase family protein [Oleiphilaceae bacterium]
MLSTQRKSEIAVVVLAAGASRRFGGIKQLAEFDGQPLLSRALRVAKSNCARPWLTLGAHADQIHAELALSGVEVLLVDRWQEGMAASLRKAVATAQQNNCEGMIVLLADQPLITKSDVERLHALALENPRVAVMSRYASGQLGVPAYLPARYFSQLSALAGDEGARKVLRNEPVRTVDVEERGRDIDTREELDLLEREWR